MVVARSGLAVILAVAVLTLTHAHPQECAALHSKHSHSQLPCSKDCVQDVLASFTADKFLTQHWDTKALVLTPESLLLNSTESIEAHRARFAGFASNTEELVQKYATLFRDQNKISSAFDVRNHGKKLAPFPATAGPKEVQNTINNGSSIVIRFEFVELPVGNPLTCLADSFSQLFGLPTTIHAYVSGNADQALDPHTDPYDTFILHLFGRKHWKVRCLC
jgi:ribosomal protein L16 Arg81 hydroxylase